MSERYRGGRREMWQSDRERAREERRRAENAEDRDALRRAAQQRPEGGYSLADFDDIPFHPEHRPEEAPQPEVRSSEGVRLQKALANAGVASRRVCEQLIVDGKVKVNGKKVTELGSRVDPEHDRVEVDGTPVQFDGSKRYLMLNKPTGVVSTMRDNQGRPDLRQFTKHYPERLYNVGRLDGETSGLLILTNDGELAHVLAHPSFGITKTYVAKVRGNVTPGVIKQLREGIELEDGVIHADDAHIVDRGSGKGSTIVELTLHSGRNRIVRRMLAHVGHPVEDLVRRSFGPLQLGTLKAGEMRELTDEELGRLLKLARRAEQYRERERSEGRGGKPQRQEGRAGRSEDAPRRASSARDSRQREKPVRNGDERRSFKRATPPRDRDNRDRDGSRDGRRNDRREDRAPGGRDFRDRDASSRDRRDRGFGDRDTRDQDRNARSRDRNYSDRDYRDRGPRDNGTGRPKRGGPRR